VLSWQIDTQQTTQNKYSSFHLPGINYCKCTFEDGHSFTRRYNGWLWIYVSCSVRVHFIVLVDLWESKWLKQPIFLQCRLLHSLAGISITSSLSYNVLVTHSRSIWSWLFLVALQTTVVAAEYSSAMQISGQRVQVCTYMLLFDEITCSVKTAISSLTTTVKIVVAVCWSYFDWLNLYRVKAWNN